MKNISGKPLIQHVIERVQHCKIINEVIVATTEEPKDNLLVACCRGFNIKVYRGNKEDVLERYYQCAKLFDADIIVRITGDCPFTDPDIIEETINHFLEHDCDYVSTSYPYPTFPDGLDVEVFSFNTLKIARNRARLLSEREHVTPYIWKNKSGRFKIETIRYERNLSNKRWTIDEEIDLQFVRNVFYALYQEEYIFKFLEILEYLKSNPEVEKINSGIMRNEGYQKSLLLDRNDNAIKA